MPKRLRAQEKIRRVTTTLRRQEPDRVPLCDFFWGQFVERWRQELGLPADAEPCRYYDMDYVIVGPNSDPQIMPFEVLRETEDEIVVRTGFGAVVRKVHRYPMPEFMSWDLDSIDKLQTFEFDDPWDERRYFAWGDDLINGVGDGFARNTDPFVERVRLWAGDFMVFGSLCDAYEQLWRMIGPERALLWIGLYPEDLGRFVERLGDFLVRCAEAQIRAAEGMLDGMYYWGDVAYGGGMFFSPRYWRRYFLPIAARLCSVAHEHNLPVIYHNCGDARAIFEDLIDAGVDAIHPLEAKAGLDVREMKGLYGDRVAFVGNLDVTVLSQNERGAVRQEVLRKLDAASGGGYIPQSDHSIPGSVAGETYDYVVSLIRSHGAYPLRAAEDAGIDRAARVAPQSQV